MSVTLPWKEFGGIFATFPAVFLVSMFITGMQYGDKVAVHVSRGAVFGMTGVLVCILVTWMMLQMTHMWLLSIIVGFLSWFISAVCIFEAVEFIAQKRLENIVGKLENRIVNSVNLGSLLGFNSQVLITIELFLRKFQACRYFRYVLRKSSNLDIVVCQNI